MRSCVREFVTESERMSVVSTTTDLTKSPLYGIISLSGGVKTLKGTHPRAILFRWLRELEVRILHAKPRRAKVG
jgi:hypothetical protein